MGVDVCTYLWIKIQFLTHRTILLTSCNCCMNCMYLEKSAILFIRILLVRGAEIQGTWSPRWLNFMFIYSFILLACAECDDLLRSSRASSIPLYYILFPATFLHQLFLHPPSPHLAICFLVYLSILLFPNSYIILFRECYFLPFSVHAQTNVIYVTLLSLL